MRIDASGEERAGRVNAEKGWKVANHLGAPALFHNGKPVTPMLFWQWELEEQDVKAMSSVGLSLFSCFGSYPHYEHPYWLPSGLGDMKYQFTLLDKLVEWSPSAKFLPRLFTAAPYWWIDANPAEQIRYSNPNVRKSQNRQHGDAARESFASLKCRRELAPVYAAAVSKLASRYGDRLIGIHLTNGPWGEHFAWDAMTTVGTHHPGPAGFGDVSAPMTAAFRSFLKSKYQTDENLQKAWQSKSATFDSASVPTREERLALDKDGWRDPALGRKVPDYFECMNQVTVDMISHYASIVKSVSSNQLATLAFYGYTQDEYWTLECDHRAISKMYRQPALDMFSAPHTYHRRKLGEDGIMRCYLASAALHGKLFIDEGDDMTHLERLKPHPDHRCHATNLFESISLIHREFGNTVTHGVGLWYMDLKKNTFRHPEIVEAVGRMYKASELSMRHDRSRCSEIAVISNVESEFYMGYRNTPANMVSERLYREQMGEFCRIGAPYDWYLAEDLDAVRARKYKVVALLDCEYLTSSQYATLLAMRDSGVKLLFCHAPGYVSETGLSWDRVRRLTGGELYKDLKIHTADELRSACRKAGVHIYNDSGCVLSASKRWLMLHVRETAHYPVRLPSPAKRVIDVCTGKTVAENSSTFTLPLEKHQTSVLFLEP